MNSSAAVSQLSIDDDYKSQNVLEEKIDPT